MTGRRLRVTQIKEGPATMRGLWVILNLNTTAYVGMAHETQGSAFSQAERIASHPVGFRP